MSEFGVNFDDSKYENLEAESDLVRLKKVESLIRECHFSPCRTYRYQLRIIWDPTRKPKMFIGLNPSTADEVQDDPTVRRCINFAKDWGCGGLVMANAFAFRSTDPRPMLKHPDPVGDENTPEYLQSLARVCEGNPIAAWGKHADRIKQPGSSMNFSRGYFLEDALRLDCLAINLDGSPKHPLYLARTLKPRPWNY